MWIPIDIIEIMNEDKLLRKEKEDRESREHYITMTGWG